MDSGAETRISTRRCHSTSIPMTKARPEQAAIIQLIGPGVPFSSIPITAPVPAPAPVELRPAPPGDLPATASAAPAGQAENVRALFS